MLKSYKGFGNRGQSVAELALVLPIFITIILGIIEFGLLMSSYITVVNAAREGCRYATLGYTDNEIIQEVKNVSTNLKSTSLTVVITPNEYNRKSGEPVTIAVEYTATPIVSFIRNIAPELYDVKSQITMRVE